MALFFPHFGLEPGASGAWRGIYAYKNACAMITAFLLPGALYTSANTLMSKCLRIMYIALTILVIGNNRSATGWVLLTSIFLYAGAVALVQKVHSSDRPIVILLGAATALSLIAAVLSYSREMLYLIGKDPTLSGRTAIWQAVVPSLLKRPILGYGYQAFWGYAHGEVANVAALKGGLPSAAHNGFLDTWLSLGIVGLLLVLFSFLKASRDAFSCIKSRRSSYLNWGGCIILLMVVANTDEKAMMVPSDLIWIMYIVACVTMSEGAQDIRLGLGRG